MSEVWAELAKNCDLDKPGRAAYARRKAVMFAKMEGTARQHFIHAGYEDRLHLGPDTTLATVIQQDLKVTDALFWFREP
jgi:hypothetical protein